MTGLKLQIKGPLLYKRSVYSKSSLILHLKGCNAERVVFLNTYTLHKGATNEKFQKNFQKWSYVCTNINFWCQRKTSWVNLNLTVYLQITKQNTHSVTQKRQKNFSTCSKSVLSKCGLQRLEWKNQQCIISYCLRFIILDHFGE